jgi:hypothetical protein
MQLAAVMKPVYIVFSLLFTIVIQGAYKVKPVSEKLIESIGLDTSHYKKQIKVKGFPVVASAKVSDFAMLEAAHLLDKMLGHRSEVLEVMARNKVRFSIMATDEFTTNVPEHGHLKPSIYWDKRARGLGADPKRKRPCVSCGVENILGLEGDPYSTESIFIHEFAHAVHIMGMNSLDETFDDRLKKQYNKATKEGLWKGTYAASNHHEYFAEGVQSWFDTNRSNDHDHGSIDTRKELLQYDPGLCSMIRETYGDSEWRYVKPSLRKSQSPHLKGYDHAKSPTFAWPEKLIKWHDDFAHGRVSLAPKGSVDAEPLPVGAPGTSKSISSRKTMPVYFHNVSGRTLVLEWIGFDGKPLQKSILRHRDHREPMSFVGHLWKLSDEKTGSFLSYYVVQEKTTRVTIRKELVRERMKQQSLD